MFSSTSNSGALKSRWVLTAKKPIHLDINWQAIVKQIGCGVFALAIVSITYPAIAVSVKDVPNPKQTQSAGVIDMANILSPETEDKIEQSLSQLAAKNGAEIAVVTVPETTPSATPKQFATELFNYWGIGNKGEDNGVLLLISKGDRRVEIETGYGVEDVLPDALVGNIIREKITPQFKQGNFDKGTLDGTQTLVEVLQRRANNTNSVNLSQLESSERTNWQILYWLLGLAGITGVGVVYIKHRLDRENNSASDEPYQYQTKMTIDRLPLQKPPASPQIRTNSSNSSRVSSDSTQSSGGSSDWNSGSRGGGDWSSGSSSSGSSDWSSGSSSSGSSDWGGGSSGGGGAGDNW